MIGVSGWHAHGPVEIWQCVVLGLGFGLLDSALDLAHSLQVLADPSTVGRSELVLQSRDLVGNGIEQTRALLERTAAFGGASALAEQALEYDPRVRFSRKRGRRRRPR